MLVQKNTVIQLMIVGTGAVVSMAEEGGTPSPAYTTTEEVEVGTIVGPCEVEVSGATFFTSAAL